MYVPIKLRVIRDFAFKKNNIYMEKKYIVVIIIMYVYVN